MARSWGYRAVASRTGAASAGPGGYANTGVHVGDVFVSGVPARSRYLEMVRRIAPPELVGRDVDLAELAAVCREPGRYHWWRASAWAGKSALMSWFVLHPPAGVRIVSFFVTARLAGQSDRTAFLDNALEQLAAVLKQPLPTLLTNATREAHFLGLLADVAEDCSERGERLVLLVDGLDEDRGVTGSDFHSIAATLPEVLPDNTVVIVSSRPNPPVPDDVADHHPLRDPAIVRSLAPSPRATAVAVDMRRELDRLLTGSPVGQDLLGLLVAAAGGLTAADLAELVADPEWPVWRVEEYLRGVAGRSFTPLPGVEPSFMLGHEELAVTAVALVGSERLGRYRERLHRWAGSYRNRGWPAGTPGYLLAGYHRMLAAEGDVPRMVAFAADYVRHERMADAGGGNRTAIAEITAAQHALLASGADLTTMALLNVHLHILDGRDLRIPRELPAVWTAVGNLDRAGSLARSIASDTDRIEALLAIADALPVGDPRGVALIAEAEADVGSLGDPEERGRLTAVIAAWAAAGGRLAEAEALLRPMIEHVDSESTDLTKIVAAVIEAGELTRAESLIALLSRTGRTRFSRFSMLVERHRPHVADQTRLMLVRAVLGHGDLKRAKALLPAIEDPFCRVRAWADLIEASPRRKGRTLLRAALSFTAKVSEPAVHEQAKAASIACIAATGDFRGAALLCGQLPSTSLQDSALSDLFERAARAERRDEAFDAVLAAAPAGRVTEALTNMIWEDRPWRNNGLAVAADVAFRVRDPAERDKVLREVAKAYEHVGQPERARAAADACTAPEPGEKPLRVRDRVRAAARDGDLAGAWRLARSITDRFDRETALSVAAEELALVGRFHDAASFAQAQSRPAQDLARVAMCAARAGEHAQAAALAEMSQVHARTESDQLLRYNWSTVLMPLIGDPAHAARIGQETAALLPDLMATDNFLPRDGQYLALAAERLGLHDLADRVVAATEYPDARGLTLTSLAATTTPVRARSLLGQALEIAWPPTPPQHWRGNVLAAVAAGLAALGDNDRAEEIARNIEQVFAGDALLAAELAAELAETACRLGQTEWTEQLIATVTASDRARSFSRRRISTIYLVRSLVNAGDLDRAEKVARTIGGPPDDVDRALEGVAISWAARGEPQRAETIAADIGDVVLRARVYTELAKHDPEYRAALEQLVAESLVAAEGRVVAEGLALLRTELPERMYRLLETLTVPR